MWQEGDVCDVYGIPYTVVQAIDGADYWVNALNTRIPNLKVQLQQNYRTYMETHSDNIAWNAFRDSLKGFEYILSNHFIDNKRDDIFVYDAGVISGALTLWAERTSLNKRRDEKAQWDKYVKIESIMNGVRSEWMSQPHLTPTKIRDLKTRILVLK